MRIGIMCHSSFGGSARIATELAKELAQRGHTVHLFTRTTPFGDWDATNGVILHRITPSAHDDLHPASLYTDWSAGEFEAFLSKVLAVALTDGLDILHLHYAVPFAFVSAEVKRRLGKASPLLVGTLHGTDVSIHGKHVATGPELAQVLRHMDVLTTVSANHATLAADVFELPTTPQIIPNFVDLSKFHPQAGRRSNPRIRSKPRLAHVSNFRPVKQPQTMAKIFVEIRAQLDAELWLIGDGTKMNTVKATFQQRAINDDVRYWGLQHDVPSLLAQTDLLLVTSRAESFCLAALEAMACGVPVLATRVGGVPEVVIDGKTGLLFEVGDQAAAVRAAVHLLSDPTQHQRMREAAAQHARLFDHRQGVSAYESLYQRMLKAKLVFVGNPVSMA